MIFDGKDYVLRLVSRKCFYGTKAGLKWSHSRVDL